MRRLVSIVSIFATVLAVSVATGSVLFAQGPTPIFINEIHYDNDGSDTGEAFEVAGPAGTDLAGWTVAFYNGSASQLSVYSTNNLAGIIPDQDNGFGVLFFSETGIQNGSPDGLALIDAGGNVVQFLSYEGTFTAGSGPAAGLTSTDIGVAEAGSAAVGTSLQLAGTGSTYEDFSWAGSAPNTLSAINTGQSFGGGGGDAAPSVSSTVPANSATDVAVDANIDVAFSEDVTVSGAWFSINCSASGAHTAVASGGPASYMLDPDTDFVEGEMCTVTVVAAQIADVDVEDPPDTMVADFVFTFNTVAPIGGSGWVINEFLADPAADLPGDANGDGTRDSTQDEFVELVNNSGAAVDISGWTIADGFGVRHTFADGTVVANQCAVLVFGGGVPTGDFGNAVVQTASTSALGLNNGGDSVMLDGNGLVQAVTNYGSEGGDNQSLTLDPDITGTAYVKHSLASASGGALFSPGTQIDGTAFAGCDAPPMAAPTLLLTEIRVTPTEGEFVEIYNPTASTIDLSNVYLTDATFSNGGTFYYNLVTGTDAGGGGFGDFNARFPAGAMIPAGAYQTVALTGSADFVVAYGAPPTYELFDDGTANGEQQMIEATAGSINNQGGLSNSGEIVILYYWDGISDLVADLDYAVWGDKAEAVDKTSIALDGPDADADTSAYQADTAIASQDVIAGDGHGAAASWQRDDLAEGAEVQSGGNGTAGADETSEDLSNTWCAAGPTPNAASNCAPTGGELGFCADPATAIHNIQGSGSVFDPAFGGSQVIEGVVVASMDGLRGFYVQEEPSQADGDPATSEGIFVYVNGAPTVQVGNVVRVLGTVGEYETTTSGVTVMQTQLEGAIQVLDCGVAAEAVVPTVVTLPVASPDDFEKFEGMLVNFSQELVISEYFNFDRFGETVLALPMDGQSRPFQPTSVTTPGAAANALQEEIERRRITMDDGRTSQNSDPALHPNGNIFDLTNRFRGGDTVTGTTGVIDQTFARYRIQPTAVPTYTQKNPRPEAPEDVGGSLTVATFNVLNYFTTLDDGSPICGPSMLNCRGADADQPEEFTRQRTKIIDALVRIDADIFGLVEIENNATAAVQDLVDGINAIAGAGTYTFVDTGTIGGDAIKVAYIYKPATVSLVGSHSILDSSVDPRFIDTKNRPALAQTFEEVANGAKFTAVINHLKSKGSACDDVGDPNMNDGQANCNGTRTNAAIALADWLATDPTGSGDPDFLILGDLNSYAMEDPIVALEAGGYTNLIKQFQGELAYSFVFDGVYGYLDHALANGSMVGQVTGVTEWHINADEPDILDYDTSFKKDAQDALYESNAYRSSDHDPVVVGLNLTSAEPERSQLNSLLKLKRLRTRYNPRPAENAPKGIVTIKARFRNRSDSTIEDIQFEVARLTRNNLLLNADGGPAGEGAILTVASDALGADGVLSPRERFVVEFKIGLQSRRAFRFAVDATGVVLDGVTAAIDETAVEFDLDVTETNFEASRENAIFLPLLQR